VVQREGKGEGVQNLASRSSIGKAVPGHAVAELVTAQSVAVAAVHPSEL